MKHKKHDKAEEEAIKLTEQMIELIKNIAHQLITLNDDGSFSASEIETQINSKRPENDQLPENEVEFFISEMIDWEGRLVYSHKTGRYKIELNPDAWEMLNEVTLLQAAIQQTAIKRSQTLAIEETWHMAIALQKNLLIERQKDVR